ncbi:Glucose dehydrogenase [FAD, quinone] [Frankliniella fusca]|uniref:Glucose dehydrogenase [FAD, quinone] n=1 Tax=Frankliniella fusca TaxID=407009 RepID=A0AAE1GU66_9NEOP|nr:Glucose dehydrogenase [FAD, quinone] [Frankliniella fusca]
MVAVTGVVSVVAAAIKAATGLVGVGKTLWFLPTFLAALAYYNYDLFDPEQRPINQKVLREEYDFIIVGGGSAGAVLANRLSEVPHWNILLLEAGGHETEISDVPVLSLYLHKSKLDWKYRPQAQETACQAMIDKRCCWTKGKVIGGSSVLNTMLYIRGNRRDYDQWASMGNYGWSFDEVLPYFKKSEDQRNPYLAKSPYHSTGGYLTVQDNPFNTPLGVAFVQAGEELGFDIVDVNGAQQTGFAFYQYTMRRGYRCSTAKAFLRPVRLRRNLHVALWAHATRVLIEPNTKRAYGVEFIRDGVKRVALARREVILSAGAVASPQLLLLSGVGDAQHLQEVGVPLMHHLPGVGQNLQDHIAAAGLTFQVDYPVSLVMNRLVNINSALRYAILGDGPLTSSVGLEAVGFFTTKYGNQTDDWPDIEFMLVSTSATTDGGTQVKKAHGLTDAFYNDYFAPLNNKDVFSVWPMILRPKSRGYVKLRSNDPLRYPLMVHNYLTHPDDIRVMREGVKQAIALGETAALKRFGARFWRKLAPGCKHLPFYTDEYWECYIRQYTLTIYHLSGTCKMGPASDPAAVVDPELRVHGIKGLRVIDASIMPRVTSGNINAPTIMVGEKGADMIKALWRDSRRRRRRRREVSFDAEHCTNCTIFDI